jgi:translation initiation factor 2B subunit (eIF-2B alpha/beta/delta family)
MAFLSIIIVHLSIAQKTSQTVSEVLQKADTLKMNRLVSFLQNDGSTYFCAVPESLNFGLLSHFLFKKRIKRIKKPKLIILLPKQAS